MIHAKRVRYPTAAAKTGKKNASITKYLNIYHVFPNEMPLLLPLIPQRNTLTSNVFPMNATLSLEIVPVKSVPRKGVPIAHIISSFLHEPSWSPTYNIFRSLGVIGNWWRCLSRNLAYL